MAEDPLSGLTCKEKAILVWLAQYLAKNTGSLVWLKRQLEKRGNKTSFQRFAAMMDTTLRLCVIAIIIIGGVFLFQKINSPKVDGIKTITADYPAAIQQWSNIIVAEATKNDLDPNLVAAIILEESSGNPMAYSPDGAVGLMQVMPKDGTAESFINDKGEPIFADRPSSAELIDPYYNVEYGTEVLADLVANYGLRDGLKAYGPADVGYSYADQVLETYETYGKVSVGEKISNSVEELDSFLSKTIEQIAPKEWHWNAGGLTTNSCSPVERSATLAYPYGTQMWYGVHKGDDYNILIDNTYQNVPAFAAYEGKVQASWHETVDGIVLLYPDNMPGVVILYYHMNEQSIANLPSHVSCGDPIGYADGGGTVSNGPHLHVEVRVDGVPVDPEAFFNGVVP